MSLVEVGRFPGVEAEIIVGRLESENIGAVAFDVGLSSVYGSIGLFASVRVMVDEEDLAAARKIIADPA
jgi:Putative prokaryotic signal transducing protein